MVIDFKYFTPDRQQHRADVWEVKTKLFKAIVAFKMKTPKNPNYLVLGQREWAEYQDLVQFLASRRIKTDCAQPASFCGLPVLMSLEESRVEAVK